MGVVGNYTMHLYCDSPKHEKLGFEGLDGEYLGQTAGECRRQARNDGWVINENGDKPTEDGIGRGKSICPKCSDKEPTRTNR